MTSISSTNGASIPVTPAGSNNKPLDQTAFLRLMTTQLKAQDPFDPMDNQAMVAQMAQFSSVTGITEMNSSLTAIAEQISAQTKILADIRSASTQPNTVPVN
jgi:flagellar basal-body rod modification protein FlgD